MRSWELALLQFAVSIVLLAGCSTIVEHARLDAQEDSSTSVTILVSGDMENVEDLKHLKSYAERADACGATLRVYKSDETKRRFVQATFSTKSRDELDTIVSCATLAKASPVISLTTSESLFSKQFRLHLEMAHYIGANIVHDGVAFPNELAVTMPGKLLDVADSSKLIGYSLTSERQGTNKIVFRMAEPAGGAEGYIGKLAKEYCPNGQSSCERTHEYLFKQRVSLLISSEKSKVDLQVIVSIVGIVLGSTMILELIKFLFRRKRSADT